MKRRPPRTSLFPHTTLFRSLVLRDRAEGTAAEAAPHDRDGEPDHLVCRLLLEKKKKNQIRIQLLFKVLFGDQLLDTLYVFLPSHKTYTVEEVRYIMHNLNRL